jgi:hypothetical protein
LTRRLNQLLLLGLVIALGLGWIIFGSSSRGILGNIADVEALPFCRRYYCQMLPPEPGSGIQFGINYAVDNYQLRNSVRMQVFRLSSLQDQQNLPLSSEDLQIRVLEFSWQIGEFTSTQLRRWLPEWFRLAVGTVPSFTWSSCKPLDVDPDQYWQWQQHRHNGIEYGVLCNDKLRITDRDWEADRSGQKVKKVLISLDLW